MNKLLDEYNLFSFFWTLSRTQWQLDFVIPCHLGAEALQPFLPGVSQSCSGGMGVGGWSQEMKGGIVSLSSCTLATWPRCFWWVEIHNGHLRATYSFISWGSGSRRTRGPAALLKCDPVWRPVSPGHRAGSKEMSSREISQRRDQWLRVNAHFQKQCNLNALGEARGDLQLCNFDLNLLSDETVRYWWDYVVEKLI